MSDPNATRTSTRQFVITTVVALLGVAATVIAALIGGGGGSKDADTDFTPPARTSAAAPTEPLPPTQERPEPLPSTSRDRSQTRTAEPERSGRPASPAQDPPDNPAVSSSANDVLVGEWVGSGNQYANDAYRMQLDMTLAPDGGFQTIRDGATRERGIYAVEGTDIIFQPEIGSTYRWGWTMATFGARPVLKIQNQYGGVFMLQKV